MIKMLQQWKAENVGYKTLNLDGILFLINDSSDELEQHYGNCNIDNFNLPSVITKRKNDINNSKYYFFVVPDKSVILQNYIFNHIDVKQCKRPHVDALGDRIIDVGPYISRASHQYGFEACTSGDTHTNMLGGYGIYTCIVETIGLKPVACSVVNIVDGKEGDLATPMNNGNRPLNIKTWKIPILQIDNPVNLIKKSIELSLGQTVDYQINMAKSSAGQIDLFYNSSVDNDDVVLIFHDSNLINNEFVREIIAQHFHKTYYTWSTWDADLINIIKPLYIFEITMERFLKNYRYFESSTWICQSIIKEDGPNITMKFNEHAYLALNADVARAVSVGAFESGLYHYFLYGRHENRKTRFDEP